MHVVSGQIFEKKTKNLGINSSWVMVNSQVIVNLIPRAHSKKTYSYKHTHQIAYMHICKKNTYMQMYIYDIFT